MTREGEREQAAIKRFGMLNCDAAQYFIGGAEWADDHPKQIEISLEDIEELAKEVIPEDLVERQETLWDMIRRNQRAQFITKACEWLEKNVCTVYNFNGDENTSTFIEDFRKAMIGE